MATRRGMNEMLATRYRITNRDKDNFHCDRISGIAFERIHQKYTAGLKEHGGHLWRKNVFKHLLEELYDAMVYGLTLEDQLDEVRKLLEEALDVSELTLVNIKRVLNVLRVGNIEGIEEHEQENNK